MIHDLNFTKDYFSSYRRDGSKACPEDGKVIHGQVGTAHLHSLTFNEIKNCSYGIRIVY